MVIIGTYSGAIKELLTCAMNAVMDLSNFLITLQRGNLNIKNL